MLTYICPKCKGVSEDPKINVLKTDTFNIPRDLVMIECNDKECRHKENYENIIS